MKTGQHVKIYNTILEKNEKIFEGYATIKKIHQGDASGVYADVIFDGETEQYPRWVFKSDQ